MPIVSVSSSTVKLIRVISLVWTFRKAKLLSEINNSHRLIKGNYIRRSYVYLYPESQNEILIKIVLHSLPMYTQIPRDIHYIRISISILLANLILIQGQGFSTRALGLRKSCNSSTHNLDCSAVNKRCCIQLSKGHLWSLCPLEISN